MSADDELGFKRGEGVLCLPVGVLDLDGRAVTIGVNAVCCVLHLVAQSYVVSFRLLSDVVIALEEGLVLLALDGARGMLRVGAS